jgi:hypothetical protein
VVGCVHCRSAFRRLLGSLPRFVVYKRFRLGSAFESGLTNRCSQRPATANHCFQFQKRSQLFIVTATLPYVLQRAGHLALSFL